MLVLEPLDESLYRQVAEWEFGAQEGVDWDKYIAEMNAPQWAHFGIYDGDSFVGAVSLEKLSRNMAAYHVVTARKRVNPFDLAEALCNLADYLFQQGFIAVTAHNPIDKRAGARLAIRCGMREVGRSLTTRYFMITRKSFYKQRGI